MNELRVVHVRMGEVKVGSANEILKTVLGSCVGIAFLWPEQGSFGLAHCLLPKSPSTPLQLGAKYVDQAIASLMTLMRISKDDARKIVVHIAGGGHVIETLSKGNPLHIGAMNVIAAQTGLAELGFAIKTQQVGGTVSRKMALNCSSAEVTVSNIAVATTHRGDV